MGKVARGCSTHAMCSKLTGMWTQPGIFLDGARVHGPKGPLFRPAARRSIFLRPHHLPGSIWSTGRMEEVLSMMSSLPSPEPSHPIREALKRSAAIVGAVHDARRLVGAVVHNDTIGRDGRIIRRYLRSNTVRKLQIGAGPTQLPGWLCTDIDPRSDEAVYLDATRRFPFEDGTFDYVYSEHMIEHITWLQGLSMLKECRRVMRPGGTLRVATPDLNV